ncbi:MAG: NTP transferase domain-containing protein [Gemmatimonas sp.]|nr:NTP transferase domain-containing protein [Gemmatimonas sp.]
MKSSLEDRLWGVVLAGGIGSRFWPASTPRRPKQLLRLASDKPLIRDTIDRIEPLIPTERLRILTGDALAGPIDTTLDDFTPENFFIEPRAAGTGPVLAWAATQISRIDPDAVMVSLPADHVIGPPTVFREQILETARLADRHERLFTLGAVPTRPETGYGYIRPGSPLQDDTGVIGATEVDRFVEKPDAETATEYVDRGYLWNTGIFVWRVHDLLAEVMRHTPEIAALIPLLEAGRTTEFFVRVPTISVDEGVFERSDRVAVAPARFQWDDVGAWDAIFRTHELDGVGNARVGDAHAVETRNSVLYADDGPVVAFGVDGLVIVRTADITFVMDRSRSSDLKTLLQALPERLRSLGQELEPPSSLGPDPDPVR